MQEIEGGPGGPPLRNYEGLRLGGCRFLILDSTPGILRIFESSCSSCLPNLPMKRFADDPGSYARIIQYINSSDRGLKLKPWSAGETCQTTMAISHLTHG